MEANKAPLNAVSVATGMQPAQGITVDVTEMMYYFEKARWKYMIFRCLTLDGDDLFMQKEGTPKQEACYAGRVFLNCRPDHRYYSIQNFSIYGTYLWGGRWILPESLQR
jgi:hypothetical protein